MASCSIVTLMVITKIENYLTLYLPTVALTVTATKKTCGSITISLTSSQEPSRNNPVIIRILYNSSVHSGEVNYTVNAALPHTENLTYLVADTEYTITAIAEYSDRTTANGTISASTVPGTPADPGRGILDFYAFIVIQYLSPTNT